MREDNIDWTTSTAKKVLHLIDAYGTGKFTVRDIKRELCLPTSMAAKHYINALVKYGRLVVLPRKVTSEPLYYYAPSKVAHHYFPDGSALYAHLEDSSSPIHDYAYYLYAHAEGMASGQEDFYASGLALKRDKLGGVIRDKEYELMMLKSLHANTDLWTRELPNRTVYLEG